MTSRRLWIIGCVTLLLLLAALPGEATAVKENTGHERGLPDAALEKAPERKAKGEDHPGRGRGIPSAPAEEPPLDAPPTQAPPVETPPAPRPPILGESVPEPETEIDDANDPPTARDEPIPEPVPTNDPTEDLVEESTEGEGTPAPPAARLGGGASWLEATRIRLAEAPATGEGGILATTTQLAPAPLRWLWTLPLLGLAGVGVVLAARQGRSPAPAAPAILIPPAPPRALLPPPAPKPRFAHFHIVRPEAPEMLRVGRDAVQAGRLEEAIAWFTQALTLDHRIAAAHFCKGVCLTTLERHEEAYESYLSAHEIDRYEGAYRLELARCCARTGRHREALDALGPLLHAVPELVDDVREDPVFEGMRDHPRFLLMTGAM